MNWRAPLAVVLLVTTLLWCGVTTWRHDRKGVTATLLEQRHTFRHDFRSLEEALAELSRAAGPRIVIDPEARQVVKAVRPFSTWLRDATGFRVLDALLAEARSPAQSRSLVYYIDSDGTVVVTTAAAQAKRVVVRAYDLSDLVWRSGPGDEQLAERRTQLEQFIQKIVDPESWRAAGGLTGTVRWDGQTIVVGQTPECHAQVSNLIAQLRLAPGGEVGRLHRRLFGPFEGDPIDAPTKPASVAYRDALGYRTLFLDP